jgi:hypothetical protein
LKHEVASTLIVQVRAKVIHPLCRLLQRREVSAPRQKLEVNEVVTGFGWLPSIGGIREERVRATIVL